MPTNSLTKMKELDVRKLLYQTEIKKVLADHPTFRAVDELELSRGEVRVDVAVIGDILHGYEIKSASDNLDRLPRQKDFYGKVFEKMTLVADERHVEEAVKIVPQNWGLIAVGMKDGMPTANEIWPARLHNELDKLALAQLLWREEALELMEYFDLDKGLRGRPRKILWQTIANKLSVKELKTFVCYKLRNRKDWKNGWK